MSAQTTDIGMRRTEAACHPAARWTETESENENWIESGTETGIKRGRGRRIETEARKETGNGTEKETKAEKENETATGNETEKETEKEMDRSDVSNQPRKKSIHRKGRNAVHQLTRMQCRAML